LLNRLLPLIKRIAFGSHHAVLQITIRRGQCVYRRHGRQLYSFWRSPGFVCTATTEGPNAPEEKVAILTRHLLAKEPISKLCEGVLRETSIAFEQKARPNPSAEKERIAYLEKDPRPRKILGNSDWGHFFLFDVHVGSDLLDVLEVESDPLLGSGFGDHSS
jgi:hypothetical protein